MILKIQDGGGNNNKIHLFIAYYLIFFQNILSLFKHVKNLTRLLFIVNQLNSSLIQKRIIGIFEG